jgi:hypothetical protein
VQFLPNGIMAYDYYDNHKLLIAAVKFPIEICFHSNISFNPNPLNILSMDLSIIQSGKKYKLISGKFSK